MSDIHKRTLAAIASIMMIIFSEAVSFAGEINHPESAEAVRNLIMQLNTTYASLNKSLKELEEGGIGTLPDTILNISVRKREKDIKLLALDIQDNNKPLESHLYLPSEDEALNAGGRHQIYKGAVSEGMHELKVKYYWKAQASTQEGLAVVPVSVKLGKNYVIDLSILKVGDLVQLISSQLDFSER